MQFLIIISARTKSLGQAKSQISKLESRKKSELLPEFFKPDAPTFVRFRYLHKSKSQDQI